MVWRSLGRLSILAVLGQKNAQTREPDSERYWEGALYRNRKTGAVKGRAERILEQANWWNKPPGIPHKRKCSGNSFMSRPLWWLIHIILTLLFWFHSIFKHMMRNPEIMFEIGTDIRLWNIRFSSCFSESRQTRFTRNIPIPLSRKYSPQYKGRQRHLSVMRTIIEKL